MQIKTLVASSTNLDVHDNFELEIYQVTYDGEGDVGLALRQAIEAFVADPSLWDDEQRREHQPGEPWTYYETLGVIPKEHYARFGLTVEWSLDHLEYDLDEPVYPAGHPEALS